MPSEEPDLASLDISSLDEALLQRLEQIAVAQGKTLAYVIFDALLEYLAAVERTGEDTTTSD